MKIWHVVLLLVGVFAALLVLRHVDDRRNVEFATRCVAAGGVPYVPGKLCFAPGAMRQPASVGGVISGLI